MRRIDADSISQQQLAGTARNEPVISYVEQLSYFTRDVVILAAKTANLPSVDPIGKPQPSCSSANNSGY